MEQGKTKQERTSECVHHDLQSGQGHQGIEYAKGKGRQIAVTQIPVERHPSLGRVYRILHQ